MSGKGNSGYINMQTGNGVQGSAGYIDLKVGTSDKGNGENVNIYAGSTTGEPGRFRSKIDTYGGTVELNSGFSEHTSSGNIKMNTAHAGNKGVSGYVHIKTG